MKDFKINRLKIASAFFIISLAGLLVFILEKNSPIQTAEAASAQNGEDGQAGGCFNQGDDWTGKTGGLASGLNGGAGGKGAPAGCGFPAGRGGNGGRGADVATLITAGRGGAGGQGGSACSAPGGDCLGQPSETAGDGGRGGDGGDLTYGSNISGLAAYALRGGQGGNGGAPGAGNNMGGRGGDGGNGGSVTLNGDVTVTSGDFVTDYVFGDNIIWGGLGGTGGGAYGVLSYKKEYGSGGNGGDVTIKGKLNIAGVSGHSVVRGGGGGVGSNGGNGGNVRVLNIFIQNSALNYDFFESIDGALSGGSGNFATSTLIISGRKGGDGGNVVVEGNVELLNTVGQQKIYMAWAGEGGGGNSGVPLGSSYAGKGGEGGKVIVKGDLSLKISAAADGAQQNVNGIGGGAGGGGLDGGGAGGCVRVGGNLIRERNNRGSDIGMRGFVGGQGYSQPGGKGGDAVLDGSITNILSTSMDVLVGSGNLGTPSGADGKTKAEGGVCDGEPMIPAVVITATPSTPSDTCPAFVNLSWSDAHTSNYNIYRCEGAGCAPSIWRIGWTSTSLVDNTVTSGGIYRYIIKAFNGADLSAESNIVEGVPQCACPVGEQNPHYTCENGACVEKTFCGVQTCTGPGDNSCLVSDFSIVSSNSIFAIVIGTSHAESTESTISVTNAQGITGDVKLGFDNARAIIDCSTEVEKTIPGAQYLFEPSKNIPEPYLETSQFSVDVPAQTPNGCYRIPIKGDNGNGINTITRTTTVDLNVISAPPAFKEVFNPLFRLWTITKTPVSSLLVSLPLAF
ncbi:hypothetical protein HYW53_01920 [Candidatus Giovannonibacteria bacterium]|nr:hypothetical protein [Candidatus Giovannonibacteria bacterium]